MKKPLLFAALFIGLVSISCAQSSSDQEEKNIKITIEEDINGKKTTTVLEGEEAEEYLNEMEEKIEKEVSIHLRSLLMT